MFELNPTHDQETVGCFVFGFFNHRTPVESSPFLFHRINSVKRHSDKHLSVKHVVWGLKKKISMCKSLPPTGVNRLEICEWNVSDVRESERERGKLEKKRLVQAVRQKLRTMGQKSFFFFTSLTHFSLFLFIHFPAGILRVSMTSLLPLNLSKIFHRLLVINAACDFST